jgi:hypothetical protein
MKNVGILNYFFFPRSIKETLIKMKIIGDILLQMVYFCFYFFNHLNKKK